MAIYHGLAHDAAMVRAADHLQIMSGSRGHSTEDSASSGSEAWTRIIPRVGVRKIMSTSWECLACGKLERSRRNRGTLAKESLHGEVARER